MQKITESTHLRLGSVRWEHLKHVLADALEKTSPEERVAALKRSCADDTALLLEAEKLLACDTAVFEQFAELAGARLNQNQQDRIGERIGAYAVIRELGRGGMGAVYLGERADGQFQKQVAFKHHTPSRRWRYWRWLALLRDGIHRWNTDHSFPRREVRGVGGAT